MRMRFLLCLPIAGVLVGLLFVSVASLVYALGREDESVVERIFDPGSRESICDGLRHEIHALSHTVSRCAPAPECEGSPLGCALSLESNVDREFSRLRDALHEQCGLPRDLTDFAWQAGEHAEAGADGGEGCELVHDGFESAVRGEARPASYSF